jgi:raffinose/stachyose/melibiose transport system permease protein
MALPAFAIYAALYLYPTFSNMFYATKRWDGIKEPQNVGLRNFTYMFSNDDLFIKALGNNFKFMFMVVLFQTGFSFIFATYLTKNTKTNIFLRTVFFFPTILSSVSVGLIWLSLYDANYGFINASIQKLGFKHFSVNWLGDTKFALVSLAITQVWFHTGQMIVIYVAGLQQIPQELYEASQMDGASKWQQFKSVTWPMALPTTAVVVAYTTIQTFRAFDLVYTMTNGGPQDSTEVLVTLIYKNAFFGYQYGYATAQSVVLVFVILFITWLQRRTLRLDYGVKS